MMAVAIEPDRAPALSVTGLRAGYGGLEVLHDVSLTVNAGEIVALMGANGAGKTTLLMAIAGFVRPEAGEVQLAGAPGKPSAHRRARQGLAFIGDDRHVFPSLTVAQNLRLAARGSHDEALEAFPELTVLWGRRAGLLSGGEQQMLSLARALAGRPKVLLVDELALGLAPLVGQRLLELLRAAADRGAAILVVEQNAKSVLAMADRVYVLRRGEVVDERAGSGWSGQLDELASLYLS